MTDQEYQKLREVGGKWLFDYISDEDWDSYPEDGREWYRGEFDKILSSVHTPTLRLAAVESKPNFPKHACPYGAKRCRTKLGNDYLPCGRKLMCDGYDRAIKTLKRTGWSKEAKLDDRV